jgi:hypothetical protein
MDSGVLTMLSKEQIDRLEELAASVKRKFELQPRPSGGFWRITEPRFVDGVMQGQQAIADIHAFNKKDDPNLAEEFKTIAEFIAAANPKAMSELIAMLWQSQKTEVLAQPQLMQSTDLEKEKLYYIAGNGMCEYLGLDHYRGETTCKFRRIELASNHRDFYYERLDCVPSRIFLSREDFDTYHKQRDCAGAQHAKDE